MWARPGGMLLALTPGSIPRHDPVLSSSANYSCCSKCFRTHFVRPSFHLQAPRQKSHSNAFASFPSVHAVQLFLEFRFIAHVLEAGQTEALVEVVAEVWPELDSFEFRGSDRARGKADNGGGELKRKWHASGKQRNLKKEAISLSSPNCLCSLVSIYSVSPIIRPTLKIITSWERQQDERNIHSFLYMYVYISIQTVLMHCMLFKIFFKVKLKQN